MGRSRLKRSAHAISPRTEHGFLGCCWLFCLSLWREAVRAKPSDPCHFTVRASITSSPPYTSLQNSRVSSVRSVAEAAEDARSLTAPLLNEGKRLQHGDVRASLHCKKKKNLSPLTGLTLHPLPIYRENIHGLS